MRAAVAAFAGAAWFVVVLSIEGVSAGVAIAAGVTVARATGVAGP
jgi:hypothetical protein